MNSDQFGKKIRELRKKSNLTQKEFADKLGVTYQAVSKWENGKNMPDITLIKEISNIFKVDIEELLTGKNKRKKKNKFIFWMLVGWLLVIGIILGIVFYPF